MRRTPRSAQVTGILLGVVLATLGAAGPAPAVERPNILIFVTDDQRLEGTIGDMPNTTAWFQTGDDSRGIVGGKQFPWGLAQSPLCCPARASIFSGRYVHNHGVNTLNGKTFGTGPNDGQQPFTFQKYLREDLGYKTGIFGKYLNQWGVSCPSGTATDPPYFDEFAIQEGGHSPVCVKEGTPGSSTLKRVWEYSNTYIMKKALDFIERNHDQPWALYIAPFAPHGPHHVQPKYENASVDPFPEPAGGAFFEQDRSDKPDWLFKDDDHDVAWNRSRWQPSQRMLKSVDELVDSVMEKVRSKGDDASTLSFFTSDNGWQWGDHGGTSKARPYLSSVRVPFYLRWPNRVAANAIDNRLAAHVDIAPTIFDALDPPPTTDVKDGISLLDTSVKRDRILTEMPGGQTLCATGRSLRWASIMTPSAHYIETYKTVDGTCGGATDYGSPPLSREYYDIREGHDPEELTNLLGDTSVLNDPPTATLSAALAADRDCSGDSCPKDGDAPPTEVKITQGPAEDNFGEANSADDPAVTGSTTARFHFTSSDPDATFMCTLEGSYHNPAPEPCLSPKQYSGLLQPDGPFTFTVTATGTGGGDSAQYSWSLDQSRGVGELPSETRIVSHPPSLTRAEAWFSIEGSNSSNVFECRLDDAEVWTPCPPPAGFPWLCASGQSCTAQYTNLPDGPHTLMVRAIDASDITDPFAADPTPARYEWWSDKTPITIDPATDKFKVNTPEHAREASFKFRALEAGEHPGHPKPGVDRFECRLQNQDHPADPEDPDAGWEQCIAPAGSADPIKRYENLPLGQQSWQVRVVDRAGNVSAPYPETPHAWEIVDTRSLGSVPDTTWPQVDADIAPTDVRTIVPDGCGGWYVGGRFSSIGGVPVENLAHINENKAVDATWKPDIKPDSSATIVRRLLLTSDKRTLYVAGGFATVRDPTSGLDQDRTNLAAVTTPFASDCTAAPTPPSVTSWNVAPSGGNAVVYDIAFVPTDPSGGQDDSKLYAVGSFTSVVIPESTTVQQRKVVRLNTTGAGSVDTSWNAELTGSASPTALAAKPDSLYIGGNGTMTLKAAGGGTVARDYLAELDATTAEATPWNPSPDGSVLSLNFLPAAPGDGALGHLPSLFVGGTFSQIGCSPASTPSVAPCTPAARSRVAQLDITDGDRVTAWDPNPRATDPAGGSVTVVKAMRPTQEGASALRIPDSLYSVLLGGQFAWAGPPSPAIPRSRLAEVARGSGAPLDWDPSADKAAHDIALNGAVQGVDEVVAVGGGFDSLNGGATPRRRLAFFCRPHVDPPVCPAP